MGLLMGAEGGAITRYVRPDSRALRPPSSNLKLHLCLEVGPPSFELPTGAAETRAL